MASHGVNKPRRPSPENNVKVRIRSDITRFDATGRVPDGENESIEYVTEGLLRERGGLVSLSYEESRDVGMSGVLTNLVFQKTDRSRLSLVRRGFSPVSMVFDTVNPRHVCTYSNDVMPLEFCIFTREIQNGVEPEKGGVIRLDYDIEIHGFRAERNRMTLSLSPLVRTGG